jgi:hypothetical protein
VHLPADEQEIEEALLRVDGIDERRRDGDGLLERGVLRARARGARRTRRGTP